MRDKLLLLQPGFEDPAYPGERFYCWHCALIEGLLAGFPHLAARLDVERVPWPRPREAVVALLGAQNQSLPALILAGAHRTNGASLHEGRSFIADKDAILAALAERHGFPREHP